MGKSTRWVAALGAAGVLAGGGAALASVPLPATASGRAPSVVASKLTTTSPATQAKELGDEAAALQRAIDTARAQLAHVADQKGTQLADRQASLDAESQQLAAEQAQLEGEAQQLTAEQARLQQEADALAASSSTPPSVHATTGASGSDGGDS